MVIRREKLFRMGLSISSGITLWLVLKGGRFQCEPFDDASGRGYRVSGTGDYSTVFTLRDFHTRLARLRAMAFTRSPARPVRRQNRRARSIAPRCEK